MGFAEEKIEHLKQMHFIGRSIAGSRQNIDFQLQKVGGQRIGFEHKDWKVGGQLPALPNKLRRLCLEATVMSKHAQKAMSQYNY